MICILPSLALSRLSTHCQQTNYVEFESNQKYYMGNTVNIQVATKYIIKQPKNLKLSSSERATWSLRSVL